MKDEWRAIVLKAWSDQTFLDKLENHTNEVLKEYNIPVPPGVQFKLVKDQLEGTRYLVLPPPPGEDARLSIDHFGRDAESGDPGF